MNILITGATGFIGRPLCRRLLRKGHGVTVLTRRPDKVRKFMEKEIRLVESLQFLPVDYAADVVINLAGAGIADKRWTDSRKKVLEDSRLQLTRDLTEWMCAQPMMPQVFISMSAVGYYGSQGDIEITERSEAEPGYSHDLCDAWERQAQQALQRGIRTCIVRAGVVLGPGGFLSRLLPTFRLGMGGPLGNGKQWLSWIHRDDLVDALFWLMEQDNCAGAYNAVAPYPIRQGEFARQLGHQIRRPASLRLPAFMVKWMFGQMGEELLLGSQRALPERLLGSGFEFSYPEVNRALQKIFS